VEGGRVEEWKAEDGRWKKGKMRRKIEMENGKNKTEK
jgi:hypothetical protein